MVRKLFGWVIIAIALLIAILGVSLPRQYVQWVILATNFFEVMIPVLIFGGIVNYIWHSNDCSKK